MVAVRALQSKDGIDLTPELGTILELARVREDSYVMRQDVVRVASYYMQQWAGVARCRPTRNREVRADRPPRGGSALRDSRHSCTFEGDRIR